MRLWRLNAKAYENVASWTTYGPALSAPIGVIHWASTDTAMYWSAYMEGAVDAGERAARAVIDELAR
jgi:monoamine oxidase